MREALRRHVDLLPQGFDLILHPRRIVLTIEFAKLEAEIVRILQQARVEAARMPEEVSARMTRVLLAALAFYKRWLSPALHSLSPGSCKYLPTCSEYAAEAIAIARTLARHRAGGLEAVALPSFCARRSRSGSPGHGRQDLFPTNHYHRRSGGPTAARASSAWIQAANDKEVSFGRNSQSQSSDARPRRQRRRRRRYALHAWASPLCCWLFCLATSISSSPSRQRPPADDADAVATAAGDQRANRRSEPGGSCERAGCRLQRPQCPRRWRQRPPLRTSSTGSSSPIAARR